MYEQYKPRHPIAWGIIAGIALFSAVAFGAIQGWLPVGSKLMAAQTCADCAVVESIKTIESPATPPADTTAAAEAPADGSAVEPAAPAADAAAPEQVAAVTYGYEITVRFDDGTTSVISLAEPPTWKSGDKVRVVEGKIQAQG